MNALYFKALKEYLGYTSDELAKIKDIVFDPAKVRYVVEVLQGISFTVNRFDVIGDFFEGIVRGEFKQSKGQYLTHTNLIRFIVQGLQLGDLAIHLINTQKRLPHIIDPACGSGAFLIECMRTITDHVAKQSMDLRRSQSVQEFAQQSFPSYRRNAWAREFVYGIEINGDLAAATKVNMVGHGDGSANIEARDALLPFTEFHSTRLRSTKSNRFYPNPVNEQFDVVLSNPPFSVTVDRDTALTFPANYLQGSKIAQSLKSSTELEVATELLFVERYYQLLRPEGRLGVVLPESVFDAASTLQTRLFIFKYFHVLGIVSLPDDAFAPYTTTKTAILFAQKKTDAEVGAWEEAWDKASVRFSELAARLSVYLRPPDLLKRTEELFDAFAAAYDSPSAAGLVPAVAEEILDFIESHHTDEGFKREYTMYLYNLVSAAVEGQQSVFCGLAERKRTLWSEIDKFVGLLGSGEELLALLQELLGDQFDLADAEVAVRPLVEKYREEIRYADRDWWMFRQVAQTRCAQERHFLCQVSEIGYKRGVRGEDDRPNELYQVGPDGEVIANHRSPKSALDLFIAASRWRNEGGV